MMDRIWSGMMIVAVAAGLVTGRIDAVASAAMTGAAEGVTLLLSVVGMMCLWTGLMEVASSCGATRLFARLISPLLRLLFPSAGKESEAAEAISMSMAANLLGLGSAATPFGLRAMRLLSEQSPPGMASDDMVSLVVLNTASIQLIPSTVAMIRTTAGSASPLCILPCVWISSLGSVAVGLTVARILSHAGKRRERSIDFGNARQPDPVRNDHFDPDHRALQKSAYIRPVPRRRKRGV